MNSRIYNIVYAKLIQWLTPAMLRKPKMLAWISICISPVGYVYNNLLRFRTQTLYTLKITPQVCYLEKLLNDRYDYINRGIYITDAFRANPVYMFQDVEDKPVPMFADVENQPVFMYTDGEVGDVKNDFVVVVPLSVSFNVNEMTSLINNYKLASKRFTITQR